MSENIELVKRSFEALGSRDLDALLGLYDPDVQFLPLTGTRVGTGGYRGHDGVRAYFERPGTLWDVLEPHGREYVDLGNRVLVAGSCRFRGRSSGAKASPPAPGWSASATAGSSLAGPAQPTTRRSTLLDPSRQSTTRADGAAVTAGSHRPRSP